MTDPKNTPTLDGPRAAICHPNAQAPHCRAHTQASPDDRCILPLGHAGCHRDSNGDMWGNDYAVDCNSHDALVAALADARIRFANIADEAYAQSGCDLTILQRQAEQGRDAMDASIKAAKGEA